jgi:CelD/BcsL family acetyltransferase involved in cellulose biosynthesis
METAARVSPYPPAARSPLTADVLRPSELSSGDIAAWRRFQALEPAFGSPLLGADFAQAVGEVRPDARVAVFRRGGDAVGFLAHHRRPSGFARPIGAPFSDYHALISDARAPVDQGEALEAAGIDRLRLTGLIDPFHGPDDGVTGRAWAHRIVLTDTAEAYLDALGRGSRNRLKNHRRYRRALEQAIGPVRLVARDHDPAAFERLIAWKRRQIQLTGAHDFLGVDWTAALMRRLYETRTPGFEGLMVSLYAGKRLVAAHFGVRQGDWFHPWLGAFDPDLRAYSPGLVHQIEAIGAMPELGLRTYDLGPSNDHWKQMFTTGGVWIGSGLATRPSLGGQIAKAGDQVWRAPLIGRLRARLDQIASLELTLAGRLQGAAHAVAAQRGRRRRATPLSPRSIQWALS